MQLNVNMLDNHLNRLPIVLECLLLDTTYSINRVATGMKDAIYPCFAT